MKKKWAIFIIVVIILVIAGVALVIHRKHQLESIRIETKLPVPVDTAEVEKGEFLNWQLYIGVLKSNSQSTVRSRVQGQVSTILKREGDFVKKGEALIELDGYRGAEFGTRKALLNSIKNQKKAIKDMEKTVENLKKIYKRDLNLYQNKAISKQALELSENRLKEGEIKLATLKTSLSNLEEKYSFFTVKSPFSGVISKVIVNIGDVVMPSMPLMKVENKGSCKLVVPVSTDDVVKIKKGFPVRLLYNGNVLNAKVSRVYPSAGETGMGFVEIDLNEHPFSLPLGSRISVKIPSDILTNATLVPDGCVLTSSAKNIVFKVENDRVEPVNVKILGFSSDYYAVEGNLKEGDIVVKGSDSLLMRLNKDTRVKASKGE